MKRTWRWAVCAGALAFSLAVVSARPVLADDGPSKGDAAVALRSARLYMGQQLWDKALEQLDIAIRGDSTNAEAHFSYGKINADKDNIDQMNAHFDLAVRYKPGKYDKEISAWREKVWAQHYNNGVRAFQKDKMEEAAKEFGMAMGADSSRADSYKILGLTYLRMDKGELGMEILEKAVKIDPKDKSAFVNLGIAYHNAAKPEKELWAFESAAKLDPKSAEAQTKLVMGYETLAQATQDSVKATVLYDSAMAACDRAMALDVKNAKIAVTAGRLHLNRAMRLATSGKKEASAAFYTSAEKYLKTAVELDTADVSSVFNLGLCYTQLEKLDEAAATFKKAVGIDPKDLDSWMQLGYVQTRQKDLDGAIATFKQVIKIKPKEVRAWEFLASLYAQKDMPKEAKIAYDTAQALKAGNLKDDSLNAILIQFNINVINVILPGSK